MVIIFLYAIILIYLYNTFITFFAWKKYIAPKSYESSEKQSFAILIACHNEEEVIADNLEAIYKNDYDKDKYHVYVIADNCSDNTIPNVEKFMENHKDMNCEVITVRGGSKPKALNIAVNELKSLDKWNDKDNIIILDSDNKISPGMLSSYNYYHVLGDKILQCRILSDNDSTIVSKGFTSSFNAMGLGFQLAKNRIGLSASLSGTGFSVNREVFDEVDFKNCDTLTEDLEFTILAIMEGYKVKYVQEQYVLNQNLDELKPSIVQRVRWCRGHAQVSVKLSWKVFVKFIKKPTLQLFDTFIFMNSPSRAVIYVISATLTVFSNNYIFIPGVLSGIIVIYNIFFILYCDNFKFKYIISHIYYSLFMFFIIIYGAITYKNKKWVKTQHKKLEANKQC